LVLAIFKTDIKKVKVWSICYIANLVYIS